VDPRNRVSRYQLFVSDSPGDAATIRIYDSVLKRILLAWQGEVARRLIESHLLRYCAQSASCHGCDKKLVHTLALTAASIAMDLEHRSGHDLLSVRLQELDRHLPAFHTCIANVLFSHPGRHFGHEEVVCLLSLRNPSVCRRQIDDHLDDLVRWQVVQRVAVDRNHVFYDINTTPHLHVYCERRQELFDAPVAGVLRMTPPSPSYATD
jgi:Fe2+ or Zn2+ uptake regulation protein